MQSYRLNHGKLVETMSTWMPSAALAHEPIASLRSRSVAQENTQRLGDVSCRQA